MNYNKEQKELRFHAEMLSAAEEERQELYIAMIEKDVYMLTGKGSIVKVEKF